MRQVLAIAATVVILGALLYFFKEVTCFVVDSTNTMLGSSISCPFG